MLVAFRRTLGAWLLVAATSSCASPPPTVSSTVDRARKQTRAALVQADEAVLGLAPYELGLRHNPAPCECPPFEIRYGGTWRRVILAGDETQIVDLERSLRGGHIGLVMATPTGRAEHWIEGGQLFEIVDLAE